MKRWPSVNDMPELANFSVKEKRKIILDSSVMLYGHWQLWVGLIGILLIGMLEVAGVVWGGSSADIISVGAIIAAGLFYFFVLAPAMLRIHILEIRKTLAGRKVKMKWTVLISIISILVGGDIGAGIGSVLGYRQGEDILHALGPAAWIGHGLAERNGAFVKHLIFMGVFWGGLWGMVICGIFAICVHRWRSWRSQVARAV